VLASTASLAWRGIAWHRVGVGKPCVALPVSTSLRHS